MNIAQRIANYIDLPRLTQALDRRLTPLALIGLFVLIFGHILGVTTWYIVEHHHLPWWARIGIGLAVFLIAAAWLCVHRFTRRGAIIFFTLALIAGHWMAMDLHHWWEHNLHWSNELMAGIAIIGFLGCHILHHYNRHHWQRWINFERTPASQRPVEALVLFVSPPSTVPDLPKPAGEDEEAEPGQPFVRFQNGAGWVTMSGSDINADLVAMNDLQFHNWQQLLRAIKPHRNTLKHLWLVGSPSASKNAAKLPPGEKAVPKEGSKLYLSHAKEFLKPYLSAEADIKESDPVDFEDFDELRTLVQGTILPAIKKVPANQRAIDITGGFKVASLVGGLMTANDQALAQYVQTIPGADNSERQAMIYDIRYDEGPDIPA